MVPACSFWKSLRYLKKSYQNAVRSITRACWGKTWCLRKSAIGAQNTSKPACSKQLSTFSLQTSASLLARFFALNCSLVAQQYFANELFSKFIGRSQYHVTVNQPMRTQSKSDISICRKTCSSCQEGVAARDAHCTEGRKDAAGLGKRVFDDRATMERTEKLQYSEKRDFSHPTAQSRWTDSYATLAEEMHGTFGLNVTAGEIRRRSWMGRVRFGAKQTGEKVNWVFSVLNW